MIKFVRESKIIVALFKCNLALHMETVKQILSKLFKIMPWDILELAVESGRIKLCNYFLGKLDIHHFQHFCKKFEARSKSLVEIKDFIDAFNIIEGQTTNRYIKESCQQTIFELFNRLAANDALSSMDFINSFLQGREQMLTPYIEK